MLKNLNLAFFFRFFSQQKEFDFWTYVSFYFFVHIILA